MGIIVFLYGIVIGSFLNVCIYRIPNEMSIVNPPSHCGTCNTRLRWNDLIPILSYILLKGRCRYCGDKLSIRYPLIEGFTGILFVILYLRYGISFEFFKFIFLTIFLIVTALIDFDTTDVYSSVVYTGMAAAVIFMIIEKILFGGNIVSYVIGALISGGIFGIIYILTHGIGAGDIEIAVMCSLFLGWRMTILFVLVSFIVGGAIAVYLLLSGRKSRKDYIPLGPSLAIGAYLVLLTGQYLLRIYSL